MGEKCFGALALPAESKKHDLLRETKCAPTSWGRNEFKRFGWIRWKSWEKSRRNGKIFCQRMVARARSAVDGAGIFSSALYGFNYAPWTLPKRGKGVDIHKAIGRLPKPKKGWTLPGHNYTGPYNPLEQQLRYDPTTGEILEYYVKPSGKTDAIAAQHDVDYSVCGNDRKCKNKADRKMVKSLDAIPWKERQWGHALARNVIDVKQKLGLGVKNGKRF